MNPEDDRAAARRVIARNAANLVMGQFAATALGFVLSAVLGRTLGAHDFGLYFLIISFSAFGFVLLEWGQPLYLVKELASDPDRTGVLFGTALLLRVIGTALIVLPFGLVSQLLGYGAITSFYIITIFWMMLPLFLAQAYGIVFRSRDRMDMDAAILVINRFALLVAVVVAFSMGGRLASVLVAQGVAGLIALIVAVAFYRRSVRTPLSYSSASARELIVAGGAFVPLVAAANIQPYIDAVLLAKFSSPDVVGWYGAARNIANAIFMPALVLGPAFYPRLSRVAADVRAIEQDSQPVVRPFLWLGGLAATGTLLFADKAIVIVYGQVQFDPSIIVLKVLAPALLLLFTNVLLGYVLLARDRAMRVAGLKLVSIVVATSIAIILIPSFQESWDNGGLGVAVAFVVSEVIVFAGQLYLLNQEGIRLKVLLATMRALGAAAITLLVFWWLPDLPITIELPLSVCVFGICSFAIGLARWNDARVCIALLRRSNADAHGRARNRRSSGHG